MTAIQHGLSHPALPGGHAATASSRLPASLLLNGLVCRKRGAKGKKRKKSLYALKKGDLSPGLVEYEFLIFLGHLCKCFKEEPSGHCK